MKHQTLVKAIEKAGFNHHRIGNQFWSDNLKNDRSISWFLQGDKVIAAAKHYGQQEGIFGNKTIKSLVTFLKGA